MIFALRVYSIGLQSFDFERTWWRLFRKRTVRTKCDIYVFIWHLVA